ncbi:hypothetical protein [Streptomyces venezuelae]|uniref:hypothetical protein n=1 Tax=Streptomyces venezuelae TaxID=54571 RepID=UPI003988B582
MTTSASSGCAPLSSPWPIRRDGSRPPPPRRDCGPRPKGAGPPASSPRAGNCGTCWAPRKARWPGCGHAPHRTRRAAGCSASSAPHSTGRPGCWANSTTSAVWRPGRWTSTSARWT